MKIYGIVPARMDSSRFPGKPLHPICGKPMIEHVFRRAELFQEWDDLSLATCDKPIADFAIAKKIPYIMTSQHHVRCLDRVAEAINNSIKNIAADDIIVCVQGDEPMLHPEMITAVVNAIKDNNDVSCSMLAMPIIDPEQFYNPDIVKIIHNIKGDVLYTSRSPVPYCKQFNSVIGAKRVSGIFAFHWHFLKIFNALVESPLELHESCDSNRIVDHGYKQRVAPIPYQPYFSVDSPPDIEIVERYMPQDRLCGTY
jgi:3-deoxy-manno-octulosonate cytidylyltransferase (CMP-KDO synthetase)